MKIWITGIAGFLGSHLAEELLALGHQVHGNDSFVCGDIKNIPVRDIGSSLIANGDNQDHSLDCRDYESMLAGMNVIKPDVVIHCAATAHEGLSSFSPAFITSNIYDASVTTFSAAIAAGVKRIVFMSSMARYGKGLFVNEPLWSDGANEFVSFGPPFKESYQPDPVDPYGVAKVAAEDTLRILAKTHGIEYVIAVPHNIIGLRQRYNDPFRNVASIMINRALQGKPILVYGDGKQKRCFSPIKDCLHSLVQMIDASVNGEVINIGPDGGFTTVLELAEIIRDLTGGMAEIHHMPDRPNEVKEAYCSSEKARKLLGFNPQQSVRECLAEMVEHIKKEGVKPFDYGFPIEIEKGCPVVWKDRML